MKSEISWPELEEKMRKSLKLKLDTPKRTLTIVTKHKISKEISAQDVLQGSIGLMQMTNILLEEPVDFSMETLADGKGVLLHFKDDNSLHRMHAFLKDLLFGKELKKLKTLQKRITEPIEEQERLRKQRIGKTRPKQQKE